MPASFITKTHKVATRPLQPGQSQKFLLACIETYFTVNVAPVLLPVSGFINAVKNKTKKHLAVLN